MKAIRKKSETREDRRAGGFSPIGGTTFKRRIKQPPYPQVWGYIRPKRMEHAFECHHCAQKFQSVEELRQHEVDCRDDDANKPL
jgi:hypothetical protein